MKKKYTQIVYTIILSIVAAAIWEKLLSKTFDKLMNYVFSFGNRFIQWMSNLAYSRIAEGVYVNVAYYIFIVIVSCILGAFTVIIWNIDCVHKDTIIKEKDFNTKKSNLIFKIVIGIFYISFLLFLLTTNFVNDNITRTTNNIEILSPYLSDQEYKVLISRFHTVKSKNDYENLYSILKEYAIQYDIELK